MPEYNLIIKNLEETVKLRLLQNQVAYIGTNPSKINLSEDTVLLPITIDDSSLTLSREHGKFNYSNGQLFYTDLESTNGTRILERSDINPNYPVIMQDGLELILGKNVKIKIQEAK